MSLLRALRAYVGLGPDEDYDNLLLEREARRSADRNGTSSRRRGGYLDDIEPPKRIDDEADDVVDISHARIQARRADGSVDPRRRSSANQSRSRIGESGRRERLSENDQLLEELAADLDRHQSVGRERNSRLKTTASPSGGEEEVAIDLVKAESEDHEGAVVRSMESARSRPRTLTPETFGDAKDVADEFKRGTPVVINLQGLDRDLVRRIIDFASGICYALDGSMEKLASQVFLLIPEGMEVSEDDRRRIEQRGYAR